MHCNWEPRGDLPADISDGLVEQTIDFTITVNFDPWLRNNTRYLWHHQHSTGGERTRCHAQIGEPPKDHALAGITVESMPYGEPGVLVTNVASLSQAEGAALRENDILFEINRKSIRHIDDFTQSHEHCGTKNRYWC